MESIEEIEGQRDQDQQDQDHRDPSGVLEHDRFQGVRHVLAAVDGRLELVDQILPFEDVHRLVLPREQLGDGLAVDAVAFVLQSVDLDPVLVQAGEPTDLGHGLLNLIGGSRQDLGLLPHLRQDVLDPVQHEQVGYRFDSVKDVVEVGRQMVDVLPVEGSDERRIQRPDDLVRDLVALVNDTATTEIYTVYDA